MFRSILVFALGAFLSASSFAAESNPQQPTLDQEQYFTVDSIEIQKVSEGELLPGSALFQTLSYAGDCSAMAPDDFTPQVDGTVVMDQIIGYGKQLWQIIEKGRPVVNVRGVSSHALPRGVKCWTDLDGWQVPKVATYNVSYKNLLGSRVVGFEFKVVFSHGGGMFGQGQYIANAQVIPTQLDVVWGYNFDAQVRVGQILNLGSSAFPKAGMELELQWSVKTPLKSHQMSKSYFVQGDGQITEL